MPGRKALSRWSDAVRCLSICLAISAFIVGPSLSQTIPEQIDSVISDQNETVRRYSAPRKPGTIDLSVPDARKTTPPEQAERILFTLRSVTVRGAVTVPASQLQQAWAYQLSKRISLGDLYAIAERGVCAGCLDLASLFRGNAQFHLSYYWHVELGGEADKNPSDQARVASDFLLQAPPPDTVRKARPPFCFSGPRHDRIANLNRTGNELQQLLVNVS
ncbi:hypothetical protein [Mesorhizobium muleiense]|uniref:Uncharacterized protein n=1 Tax=Mesorhizobium muleiense TaxID=1004279 RepID=A0A1G9B7K3_9HYPH|nr:hypothetical protein [Mesorhizobium muleiense]MCF6102869.1 hypothetical protein [Mesorhizobium muleiense]SDK35074.1 hypothetical protein SAMN05428953_11487 [Mesorhizobium muleiense]